MAGISNHPQMANMWQWFVTCICWTTTAAPLSDLAILTDALFDPEHWTCLIEKYCHQNHSLLFLSPTSPIQRSEVKSSSIKAVWFSHFWKGYLCFHLKSWNILSYANRKDGSAHQQAVHKWNDAHTLTMKVYRFSLWWDTHLLLSLPPNLSSGFSLKYEDGTLFTFFKKLLLNLIFKKATTAKKIANHYHHTWYCFMHHNVFLSWAEDNPIFKFCQITLQNYLKQNKLIPIT